LRIRGNGKSTGKTEIVAVFRQGGETIRSAPFPVHFAQLGDITEGASPSKVAEHEYVLSRSGPALSMPLRSKAWLDGAEANDRIQWDIEERGAALFKHDKARGESVTFEADTLPENNDPFGPRNVNAKVEEGSCACTKRHPVRLFFSRDDRSNPGGEEPNWSYYWKQTTAGKGFEYNVVNVIPPSWAHADPVGAIARYDAPLDKVFVLSRFMKIGCVLRPDGSADRGIDCYAVTLRHETRHRAEFIGWWGLRLANYSMPLNPFDPDGDYVPNDVEDAWGCNWREQQSCPSLPKHLLSRGIKDIEATAYAEGWKWVRGTADTLDWACPGKQTRACGAE
jgi:hypothetical protein